MTEGVLAGRTALVTGASRGIGVAIATRSDIPVPRLSKRIKREKEPRRSTKCTNAAVVADVRATINGA